MTESARRRGRPAPRYGERLRRLLAILPWLLEREETTVAEVAARFEMTEEEVVRDLSLVSVCGLPPYSADELIDLWIDDDGTIGTFNRHDLFIRPINLTPAEGFAVLAAGRALLAVPGAASSALESALAKLEAALGTRGGLAVDLVAPPHLAEVQSAAQEHERLAIAYYSAWRDEQTRRVIDPWLVHSDEGRWYVECHDSLSGEHRRLRVDRILEVRGTGEHFEPVDFEVPERTFEPGPEAQRVVLALPTSAQWAIETYGAESVTERDDGRLGVELFVAGETWLARLLLKAGAEAEVLDPPELRDVAARAAQRLLARYESSA